MPGESLTGAAEREAAQVRRSVGLFDASPLGKIEVCGPDAAAFLDLMYVGTMSTLPVGGARYGVLLDEHGVIVDDGIVARLAPGRFWVNTTSGGVATKGARGTWAAARSRRRLMTGTGTRMILASAGLDRGQPR